MERGGPAPSRKPSSISEEARLREGRPLEGRSVQVGIELQSVHVLKSLLPAIFPTSIPFVLLIGQRMDW